MRRVVIRPHVSQVRLTLLVPQPKGTILGSFEGLQQSSNRMIFHLETINVHSGSTSIYLQYFLFEQPVCTKSRKYIAVKVFQSFYREGTSLGSCQLTSNCFIVMCFTWNVNVSSKNQVATQSTVDLSSHCFFYF